MLSSLEPGFDSYSQGALPDEEKVAAKLRWAGGGGGEQRLFLHLKETGA
jgi:hypothetical protein